jgi:hypothetical protein
MNPITKNKAGFTSIQYNVGTIDFVYLDLGSQTVKIRDIIELENFIKKIEDIRGEQKSLCPFFHMPKLEYNEQFFDYRSLLVCVFHLDKSGNFEVENVIKRDNVLSIRVSYNDMVMDVVYPYTIIPIEVKKTDIVDIDRLTLTLVRRNDYGESL